MWRKRHRAGPHSTVKCTTCFPKDFVRRLIVQTLPWPIVQELFDASDLPLSQLMEVGAFGEEPPDSPIALFHAAFLPTVIRRTKEGRGPQSFVELFMAGILTPIVIGDRLFE